MIADSSESTVHKFSQYLKQIDLPNIIFQAATNTKDLEKLLKSVDNCLVFYNVNIQGGRKLTGLQKWMTEYPELFFVVLFDEEDKDQKTIALKIGVLDFLSTKRFDKETIIKTLNTFVRLLHLKDSINRTQETAHIGNWTYSEDARIFEASPQAYRILGLNPEKSGVSFKDLNNPGCRFHFIKNLYRKTITEKEVTEEIELQFNGKDTTKYLNVSGKLILSPNNDIIIEGFIKDVSAPKKINSDLMKIHERYENLFTKSRDAIVISDYDGKLIDFNDATTNVFGYSRKELNNLESFHNLFYPKEKQREFLLKLKTTESVKDFPINIEHKSKEVRFCLITANTIHSKGGFSYYMIIRDITEQHQVEKMRKERDLANKTTEMKENFLASVSHEMRTPMNAILGMSNLLSGMKLDNEEAELVSSIKKSSEVLLGIVNDILEISAIQNGKVEFYDEVFNLRDMMRNLVEVMKYRAVEKNIDLKFVIADEIPNLLVGDKLRLNQILLNLVGNAVKFTDSGFVTIEVEKLNEESNSVQLQFFVKDSGIGIANDKLGTIFESFSRVKQKKRFYEGTGLGLSIAKNLVGLQGGRINVESELGIGSSFFFDLIFGIAKEKETEQQDSKVLKDQLNPNVKFEVLVVEDHLLNQLVAKKTLKRKWENINITLAKNGVEAIDFIKQKSFDIVLMDIQMPVMDGYEATAIIKKDLKIDVPIVAMTAHAHVAKDEKFKDSGLDDFVLKPFKPEELFSKITKFLAKNLKNEEYNL